MTTRRLVRAGTSSLLLAWGAALLTRPRPTAAAVVGSPTPPAWILRVLGARQVLEQLLLLAAPSPTVRRLATGVDVLHAVSMLAAAALTPRYRRAELVSAAVSIAAASTQLAGWSPT